MDKKEESLTELIEEVRIANGDAHADVVEDEIIGVVTEKKKPSLYTASEWIRRFAFLSAKGTVDSKRILAGTEPLIDVSHKKLADRRKQERQRKHQGRITNRRK